MGHTVLSLSDQSFTKEIFNLGGEGIKKCYQCGNCTATCPLSEENIVKTRKLIKYVQLGLKDRVLGELTPWLCYYCGECSDTCPKQADPGEIMMAIRRYQIQQFSWGRIAKVFYSKTAAAVTFILFTIFVITAFYFFHGPMVTEYVDIYSFISYDLIHGVGIVAGIFIGLSALANLVIMYNHVKRVNRSKNPAGIGKWIKGLIVTIVNEVLLQLRFTKCTNGKNRYIAHMSLFWGFIGLFIATGIHYIGDILNIHVDVIYPRTLGIITGILLMYGSSYFIYKRLEKKENYTKYSHFSDWLFLILVFMTGLTGFLIDVFLYANMAMATYIMYALHLLFVFDLLVTAPFTKFVHAVYRPLALWVNGVWSEVV